MKKHKLMRTQLDKKQAATTSASLTQSEVFSSPSTPTVLAVAAASAAAFPSSNATPNIICTQLRAGDWVCLLCNNLNFSFRNECNRCLVQTKKTNFLQNMMLVQDNPSTQKIPDQIAAEFDSQEQVALSQQKIQQGPPQQQQQQLTNNSFQQPVKMNQQPVASHGGFENMLLLLTPNRSSVHSSDEFCEYESRVEQSTAQTQASSENNNHNRNASGSCIDEDDRAFNKTHDTLAPPEAISLAFQASPEKLSQLKPTKEFPESRPFQLFGSNEQYQSFLSTSRGSGEKVNISNYQDSDSDSDSGCFQQEIQQQINNIIMDEEEDNLKEEEPCESASQPFTLQQLSANNVFHNLHHHSQSVGSAFSFGGQFSQHQNSLSRCTGNAVAPAQFSYTNEASNNQASHHSLHSFSQNIQGSQHQHDSQSKQMQPSSFFAPQTSLYSAESSNTFIANKKTSSNNIFSKLAEFDNCYKIDELISQNTINFEQASSMKPNGFFSETQKQNQSSLNCFKFGNNSDSVGLNNFASLYNNKNNSNSQGLFGLTVPLVQQNTLEEESDGMIDDDSEDESGFESPSKAIPQGTSLAVGSSSVVKISNNIRKKRKSPAASHQLSSDAKKKSRLTSASVITTNQNSCPSFQSQYDSQSIQNSNFHHSQTGIVDPSSLSIDHHRFFSNGQHANEQMYNQAVLSSIQPQHQHQQQQQQQHQNQQHQQQHSNSNSTGASNSAQVKKQDWICPRCTNLNYSFRKLCNKCQFAKNNFAIHIPFQAQLNPQQQQIPLFAAASQRV